MRSSSLLVLSFALAAAIPSAIAAGTEADCPVTKAPAQPFVPPPGYHSAWSTSGWAFALGTPGLWANVTTHWILNETTNKLPFFSEDFIYGKGEVNPRLAVVARRVDTPAPLVWSTWVNGGGPSFRPPDRTPLNPNDHGFMVTSLPIPTAGCWEITAHYTPVQDKIYTLTFTVWAE